MQDILGQLIKGAIDKSSERQSKCNCSVCGLKKLAEASDSKEESAKIMQDSEYMDTIRHNILDISRATRDGADEAAASLAARLKDAGYPLSAEVVIRYEKLTQEGKEIGKLLLQEMDENNPDESEAKAN